VEYRFQSNSRPGSSLLSALNGVLIKTIGRIFLTCVRETEEIIRSVSDRSYLKGVTTILLEIFVVSSFVQIVNLMPSPRWWRSWFYLEHTHKGLLRLSQVSFFEITGQTIRSSLQPPRGPIRSNWQKVLTGASPPPHSIKSLHHGYLICHSTRRMKT
jgi:hypothetical protein